MSWHYYRVSLIHGCQDDFARGWKDDVDGPFFLWRLGRTKGVDTCTRSQMTRYYICRGAVSFVSAIKRAIPAPEDIKTVVILKDGFVQ